MRVLRVLASGGEPLTSAELTAELGGHPNTVRPHLDRLVAEGFVDIVALPAVGRGRPARAYRATIAGRQVAGQDHSTLAGAALLGAITDELRGTAEPAFAARRLGRSWGRRLGAGSRRQAGQPDLAAGHEVGPIVTALSALAGQGFTPTRAGRTAPADLPDAGRGSRSAGGGLQSASGHARCAVGRPAAAGALRRAGVLPGEFGHRRRPQLS